MKKRKVGFSVLFCSLVGCLFLLLNRGSIIPSQTNESSDVSERIVAPAIIDSLNDITRIPTLQSGTIKTMDVVVGQKVKKGDVLFSLDSTFVENNAEIQKINLEQAKNALLIQQKHIKFSKHQLTLLRSLDKRAISHADLQEKIHEVNMGIAQLSQARHQLELATANLKNAELTLRQFTIHAPKDGVILQINTHVNEFVGNGQQIIFLGDTRKILVRVSLDERDTQRFQPGARAYLTRDSDPRLKIPLTFIQLDQYIVTQERLHSRVQEALYYFDRGSYPDLVAGQQFDANISIRPVA